MKTINEFMSKDHDRLDGILEEFKKLKDSDYDGSKKLFAEFFMGLRRHIVWEEEILFPIFDEKTGQSLKGPTAVMRIEHQQIKEVLVEIHEKVKAKDMKVEEGLRMLVGILGQHNAKEENILYPWIDNTLDDKEVAEVFKQIESLPPEKYQNCCGGEAAKKEKTKEKKVPK